MNNYSLFLQGTGVQPTVRVPITEENVKTTEDIVLQVGERAVLEPLGAGITPVTLPTFLSQFALKGQGVPLDQFLSLDYNSGNVQKSTAYLFGLKDWAGGQHKVVTTMDFTGPLNDETYDSPIGQQVFEYNIYVKL